MWSNFINKSVENSNTLYIGSCTNNNDTCGYLNASVYALRVYSRALSDDEVKKNYEKSVEYHSLLSNENL